MTCLSGDPTASNGPIGSTNVQWGENKLKVSRRRVATSARAHPMRRTPLNEVSLYKQNSCQVNKSSFL